MALLLCGLPPPLAFPLAAQLLVDEALRGVLLAVVLHSFGGALVAESGLLCIILSQQSGVVSCAVNEVVVSFCGGVFGL